MRHTHRLNRFDIVNCDVKKRLPENGEVPYISHDTEVTGRAVDPALKKIKPWAQSAANHG